MPPFTLALFLFLHLAPSHIYLFRSSIKPSITLTLFLFLYLAPSHIYLFRLSIVPPFTLTLFLFLHLAPFIFIYFDLPSSPLLHLPYFYPSILFHLYLFISTHSSCSLTYCFISTLHVAPLILTYNLLLCLLPLVEVLVLCQLEISAALQMLPALGQSEAKSIRSILSCNQLYYNIDDIKASETS